MLCVRHGAKPFELRYVPDVRRTEIKMHKGLQVVERPVINTATISCNLYNSIL